MRALGVLAVAPLLVVGLASSRAQAAPAADTGTPFHAFLDAKNEVPSSGPAGGTGTALITLHPANNTVCYELTWSNLGGEPTASHLHDAAAGKNGDIKVVLLEPPNPKGCVPAAAADITSIDANPQGWYVNIHTAQYSSGAVRGQLERGPFPAG